MGPEPFIGLVLEPQLYAWSLWNLFILFFLILFLHASACLVVTSYFAGHLQRLNNHVRKKTDRMLSCSGPVNEITKSLNNASVRPIPSFEGKFSSNGFEMSLRDAKGHPSSADMSAEISNRVWTHAPSAQWWPAGKLLCTKSGTRPRIQQPKGRGQHCSKTQWVATRNKGSLIPPLQNIHWKQYYICVSIFVSVAQSVCPVDWKLAEVTDGDMTYFFLSIIYN